MTGSGDAVQRAARVTVLRRRLAERPAKADDLRALAETTARQGELDDAGRWAERATAVDPGDASAWLGLGQVEHLRALPLLAADVVLDRPAGTVDTAKRLGKVASRYRRAIALRPEAADALNNYGSALADLDVPEAAAQAVSRALAVAGSHPLATRSQPMLLRLAGRSREATRAMERLKRHGPPEAAAEAEWNLAHALLATGDAEAGWQAYETRLGLPENRGWLAQSGAPIWDGRQLTDETVLVRAEQGLGDMIQFCRYIRAIAARGGRAIVECHPPLVRLMATCPGVAEASPVGSVLPATAWQIPMMSLPATLGSPRDDLAATPPYFAVNPVRARHFQAMTTTSPRPRIGICWQGNRSFRRDPLRSPGFEAIRQILACRGASFFALSHMTPVELAASPGARPVLPMLTDLAETAAFLSGLDVVISSDTAIVHLAGALGLPTLLLLSRPADWRWAVAETSTPWYPSVRILRQSRVGDWSAPVAEAIGILGSAWLSSASRAW